MIRPMMPTRTAGNHHSKDHQIVTTPEAGIHQDPVDVDFTLIVVAVEVLEVAVEVLSPHLWPLERVFPLVFSSDRCPVVASVYLSCL